MKFFCGSRPVAAISSDQLMREMMSRFHANLMRLLNRSRLAWVASSFSLSSMALRMLPLDTLEMSAALSEVMPEASSKILCNIAFAERGYFHELASGEDCWYNLIGLVRNQQEKSFFRWLLNHFKKFVGCSLIHPFRQPDDHYFKLRLECFQAELFYYLCCLGSVNHPLCIVDFNRIEPVVYCKKGRPFYKVSPFFNIIVADRLIGFLPFNRPGIRNEDRDESSFRV